MWEIQDKVRVLLSCHQLYDMKRNRIVAGNWKMNKSLDEVREFVQKVKTFDDTHVKGILACAFPFIGELRSGLEKQKINIAVAAQNCHDQKNGAFTGEVSSEMVKAAGASYVILGHSERRQYFQESGEEIGRKVRAALDAGLKVIFCCGESLKEREAGQHELVVLEQIQSSLASLSEDDWSNLFIAYEPVWAIGTGVTASSEEAEAMHKFIRKNIPAAIRDAICILYGGSVKPANFSDLLTQPNIDGGLVGGASLNPDSFMELIDIATTG